MSVSDASAGGVTLLFCAVVKVSVNHVDFDDVG